jgi:hypothetical protein
MKYWTRIRRTRPRLTMTAFVFAFSVVCCAVENFAQTDLGTQYDSRLRIIKERIANTTPEGHLILKKVKGIKPNVNDQFASKPLGEIVKDFEQGKGMFKIHAFGWEALKKKHSGNWKIAFYYRKEETEYVIDAEWEYNPKTQKLYPFEFPNAPDFWTRTGKYGKITRNK